VKRWGFEVSVLILAFAAALAWQLHLHPIHRPRPDPVEPAQDLPTSTMPDSVTALALDPGSIAAKRDAPLKDRDWSAAWVNWLEQEVGPYRVLSAHELRQGAPAGVLLLVVSRSVARALDDALIKAIEAILARGGVVVVETPPPDVKLPAGPGLIKLDEPFSTALVQLQQGWRVAETAAGGRRSLPVPGGLTRPERLVKAGQGPALSPTADRMERELLEQIRAVLPLPRWWHHPGTAAGVLSPSYDEAGFGEQALWMPAHDSSRGTSGNFFAVPLAFDDVACRRLAEMGVQLGLSYDRGFGEQAIETRWGLGPLGIFQRVASLREQRSLLEQRCPGLTAPAVVRINGELWDPGFGVTFRLLAAGGFVADASYGPHLPGAMGYLFGTGLPFRPLDDNGLPFPVYEVPFLLRHHQPGAGKVLRQLAQASAAGDHELLQVLLPTDAMARAPSAEAMETWLGLPAVAREHEHVFMPLAAYLELWAARLRSPLRLELDPAQGLVRCHLEARGEGLGLDLPSTMRGQAALRSRVDGVEVGLGDWTRRGSHLLLPVARGGHVVEMFYGVQEPPGE